MSYLPGCTAVASPIIYDIRCYRWDIRLHSSPGSNHHLGALWSQQLRNQHCLHIDHVHCDELRHRKWSDNADLQAAYTSWRASLQRASVLPTHLPCLYCHWHCSSILQCCAHRQEDELLPPNCQVSSPCCAVPQEKCSIEFIA